MKEYEFTGHSDDILVVTKRVAGADSVMDEFCNNSDHDNRPLMVLLGGIRIQTIYDGTWSFAAGLMEEEADFPNYPILTCRVHSYSMSMRIQVEDDVEPEIFIGLEKQEWNYG